LKHIAQQFGTALDHDNFELVKTLLSKDCRYNIGEELLLGPDAIAGSYEQNMLEGRAKMDQLEWGDSTVEALEDGTCYVHFTDYLTHKGETYTHRCKQRVTIDDMGQIVRIEHMNDAEEWQRLQAWYRSVGIPTKS